MWSVCQHPEVSHAAATVRVQTELKNAAAEDASCSILVVFDRAGQVVTQDERSIVLPAGESLQVTQDLPEITEPEFVVARQPYLYSVRTRLLDDQGLVDEYHERLGIRW